MVTVGAVGRLGIATMFENSSGRDSSNEIFFKDSDGSFGMTHKDWQDVKVQASDLTIPSDFPKFDAFISSDKTDTPKPADANVKNVKDEITKALDDLKADKWPDREAAGKRLKSVMYQSPEHYKECIKQVIEGRAKIQFTNGQNRYIDSALEVLTTDSVYNFQGAKQTQDPEALKKYADDPKLLDDRIRILKMLSPREFRDNLHPDHLEFGHLKGWLDVAKLEQLQLETRLTDMPWLGSLKALTPPVILDAMAMSVAEHDLEPKALIEYLAKLANQDPAALFRQLSRDSIPNRLDDVARGFVAAGGDFNAMLVFRDILAKSPKDSIVDKNGRSIKPTKLDHWNRDFFMSNQKSPDTIE